MVDLFSAIKGQHRGRNNYAEWALELLTIARMQCWAKAMILLDKATNAISYFGLEYAPQLLDDLGMELLESILFASRR